MVTFSRAIQYNCLYSFLTKRYDTVATDPRFQTAIELLFCMSTAKRVEVLTKDRVKTGANEKPHPLQVYEKK